ncbi:MAG: DUF1587 domain-containing protein, partial [Phycisphaerales bacterium]|nr:DUF1587 domain-containing protein [Phycisphaerales bacterium]
MQPSDHEVLTIVQWLDDALAYHPADAPVDPGWFSMHRLNRVEYANTLRDLLGVEVTDLASSLPPDDTGYGFDNIADVLTVSPLHLETYLSVAEASIDRALGPVVEFSDEPRALTFEGAGGSTPLEGGGQFLYTNSSAFRTVEVGAGTYEIIVEAWGTPAGDEAPRLSLRVDREEVLEAFIEAERAAPERVRTTVVLDAGRHTIAAHFTNDFYRPDVADRNLAIASIELAGPLPGSDVVRSPSFETIFFAPPGSNDASARRAARRVLERFASRAFRRPLAGHESNLLMKVYESARREGDGYEQGVRVAMTAALVSPAFLYRSVAHASPNDESAIHRLGGHELASRARYFLWSSVPGDG